MCVEEKSPVYLESESSLSVVHAREELPCGLAVPIVAPFTIQFTVFSITPTSSFQHSAQSQSKRNLTLKVRQALEG